MTGGPWYCRSVARTSLPGTFPTLLTCAHRCKASKADPHALMLRQLLFVTDHWSYRKWSKPELRALRGKKFQLANMISARLATPVLGTHRPNFDMWGSSAVDRLEIWLSHVCSIPQSLKLKWLSVSSWEDTDGSASQIRLEKFSLSEPKGFFVPSCSRKCRHLDVNMLRRFQEDHYPSFRPRYHAVVFLKCCFKTTCQRTECSRCLRASPPTWLPVG